MISPANTHQVSLLIRLAYWGFLGVVVFEAVGYLAYAPALLLLGLFPNSAGVQIMVEAYGGLALLASANAVWSGWRAVRGEALADAARPFPARVWVAVAALALGLAFLRLGLYVQ